MKGLAIGGGVFAIIAFILGMQYVSAYNFGNSIENTIHARYEDNEQQFAQFGQAVAEAVGVAQLQAEDATALYATVLDARYGGEGMQAQIAMIQEAMPGLPSDVYTQIQRISEAGRNDFTFAQSQLIDAKRAYRDSLGSFLQGTMLSIAGYPRINIGYPLGREDDYPAITSERAAATFESGVECGNAITAATGQDDC